MDFKIKSFFYFAITILSALCINAAFFLSNWYLLLEGGVIIAIYLGGLKRIPNKPPHKGIRALFGRRLSKGDGTTKIVNEGWNFFILRPFVENAVLVDVTTKDADLPAQDVRVPDMTELRLSGNASFTPDPDHLIEYENAGGEKGIREKINNLWEGTIREWAIAFDEGPQDHVELLAAGEESTDLILKAMVKNSIDPVVSPILTPALLRFYGVPRKTPTKAQRRLYDLPSAEEQKEKKLKPDDLWKNLRLEIDKYHSSGEYPEYPDEDTLKKQVAKRRENILEVKQGRGRLKKREWGITINLLNIGTAEPLGELAKAMELEATEGRQAAGETRERDLVQETSDYYKNRGNRSREAADELTQTERGKVTKNINELKFNLPEAVLKALENVADKFAKSEKEEEKGNE